MTIKTPYRVFSTQSNQQVRTYSLLIRAGMIVATLLALALLVACSGANAPDPTPTAPITDNQATTTPSIASEPTAVVPTATSEAPSPTATAEPTASPTPSPTPTPPPDGYDPGVGTQADIYGYPAVAEWFPDGLDYQVASHQMAQRPWTPTDPTLFLPEYYVDSTASDAASGPSPTEAEQIQHLDAFLAQRFPSQPERVDTALALLSDERMLAKVADHRLRVALVALTGTVAEPAIERFLNDFLLLEFADLAGERNGESDTTVDINGVPRQQIRINSRHQHEHFSLLSVALSHELIHDDGSNSRDEERIAPMLQQIVHIQQLLTDPEIAYEQSWLQQYYNTLTLGRLSPLLENRLTVHESGQPVWPGSGRTTSSFMAYLDGYLLGSGAARIIKPVAAAPRDPAGAG